jgi:uncharacterized protein YcbK (DUF882 family)
MEMSEEFMQKIVALREKLNFPFIVNSAYRCPSHNQAVSESGLSGAHTTGKAIDIAASGIQAYHLVDEALLSDITGVGVNQKGRGRFIHLDDCSPKDGLPRPMIWSY